MPPATVAGTIPAGAQIAADALKYKGLGYVYGGSAPSPGVWDCSSFASYVLGHDFGLALPGGGTYGSSGYPPSAHGPVVLSYASWTGATTIDASQVEAGDLCIWAGVGATGHIGIATSPTTMVSALDSTDGTVETPIQGYGPAGAPLMFRRINGAAAGDGTVTASTGSTSEFAGILGAALLGAAVPVALIGIAFIGATVLGLLGAAAVAAAISAARSSG